LKECVRRSCELWQPEFRPQGGVHLNTRLLLAPRHARKHYTRTAWLSRRSMASPAAEEARALVATASRASAASDWASATRHCMLALALLPDFVPAVVALASVRALTGDVRGARSLYTHALRLDDSCAAAWHCLGACLVDLGLHDQAASALGRAAALAPGDAYVHSSLAGELQMLGRLGEAVDAYRTALRTQPFNPAAWNDVGNSLRALGRLEDSLTCYQVSLWQNEQAGNSAAAAIAHQNLGAVCKLQSRNVEAITHFTAAAALAPSSPELHLALAGTLKDAGQFDAALTVYRRAPPAAQGHLASQALAQYVHALQTVCAWDDLDAAFPALLADVRAALERGEPPGVQPFHCFAYEISPELVLDISRAYAANIMTCAARLGAPSFTHPPAVPLHPGQRLRVGYLSSDIGNHPLSHLMGSVFGLHDRSRLEVFLFALSASDGSVFRQRAESEVEHFADVSELTSSVIAARIAAAGIQVLVDLNGYTKGGRSDVLALRPSPLQLSFMGFAGSTGAPFIDHIVLDRVVAPPALRHCYSEPGIVRMPHSYFVSDFQRLCPAAAAELLPSVRAAHRIALGLPASAFIFCSSAQSYKIQREDFHSWCRILQRCPGSYLWLLRFPPCSAEARLLAVASRFGVSSRVVFTDVAEKHAHLGRSALADLFLDTRLCNSHTTACDVLWAGTPVLTLPGERLASRLAASILCALGCPDCVMPSRDAYEARAAHLAAQPQLLQQLRARVALNRGAAPCFDTRRWVRNFDAALLRVWEAHGRGEGPHDIDVEEERA